MRRAKNKTSIFVGALLLALPPLPAPAQDAWPTRSVRLVVPSSPGGGTDTYTRLLAQDLTQTLKQQFIVDNRPGASGNIGAEIAARAAPDGYTFLVSASPALVINPSLYKNLSYNAERDFAPVARGVISPLVFASHPSVPVKTLPALMALGKQTPGKITYGSAGAGSATNLVVKMLEDAAGVRFVHVPYKGVGQAIRGLLGGELDFMTSDIPVVLPHVRSGRILALAVTQHAPQLPGTPTLADVGYPNIQASASFMVVAPAGTPPAIVQRLNVEIGKTMKSAAMREKMEAHGFIAVFETPEAFSASLLKERQRWAEVIRRHRITAD